MNTSPRKRGVVLPDSKVLKPRNVAEDYRPAVGNITWCPVKPFDATRFSMYLAASLAKRQLTNGGPLQSTLEKRLQRLTGSRRPVLPAASGTAALHALASAWSIQRGRRLRWATQSFTFPPAIQGPLANSVVVDLDPVHWGPCLSGLAAAAPDIDGVIVTNVFGLSASVPVYVDWCRAHGKLLIFDNAATPLGNIGGTCIHDFGDGAAISLHETKPLGRGEGGAVFYSPELKRAVSMAMNFGFDVASNTRVGSSLASNYRMSDVAAAAILDRLDYLQENDLFREHAALVNHALAELKERGLTIGANIHTPTFWPCLFVKLPSGFSADAVCAQMTGLCRAVDAKHYYRPLGDKDAMPTAWKVFESHVCLPLHFNMTDADVDYMVAALCEIISKNTLGISM